MIRNRNVPGVSGGDCRMKFITSHVRVLDYMAASLLNAVIFRHATGHGIVLLRQRKSHKDSSGAMLSNLWVGQI